MHFKRNHEAEYSCKWSSCHHQLNFQNPSMGFFFSLFYNSFFFGQLIKSMPIHVRYP